MRSFIAKRQQRNIWWYGIVNQSDASDLALFSRQNTKREVKMIQGYHLPVEINVYGSKIAIKSTGEETLGFVLDHQPTAQLLQSLHQSIWNTLPDYVVDDHETAKRAEAA